MRSKLERTLLQDERINGNIRHRLFIVVERLNRLTALRLASSILKRLIDQKRNVLFRHLTVHAPLPPSCDIKALQRTATFCTTLTIKVMYLGGTSPYTLSEAIEQEQDQLQTDTPILPQRSTFLTLLRRRKPRSQASQQAESRLWKQIFSLLPNLIILNISINADPGWPGQTEVEHTLIYLRLALESATPPRLRKLSLNPVHAAGILHLRWAGFGAFTAVPKVGKRNIWTSLTALDIKLRNPSATGRLTPSQLTMFYNVLDDFLRSFSVTLKVLKFEWLDAKGLNPLALDEVIPEGRKAIIWEKLEEVRIGNVLKVERMLDLVGERARNCLIVSLVGK